MWVTKQFLDPTTSVRMKTHTHQQLFGYPYTSKLFCYGQQKKKKPTGLDQLEGE